MRIKNNGFSLMEVIVVLAVLAILAVMAIPSFNAWRENAQYREAARNIASILRDARSTAISRSNPHRVVVDTGAREVFFQAAVNGEFDDVNPVKIKPVTLQLGLTSGEGCDEGDIAVIFRSDGSADSTARICIFDSSDSERFYIEVTSLATGRVEITRP